jgi:hypothetical protein
LASLTLVQPAWALALPAAAAPVASPLADESNNINLCIRRLGDHSKHD